MDYNALMEIIKLKNCGIPQPEDLEFFDMVAQSDGPLNATMHASNATHNYIEQSPVFASATDQGFSPDADLKNFLERKLILGTSTWSVGGDLNDSYYPWANFLVNPAVKRKLDNYSLLKGDLEISFTVNGTPFHSGMALASYSYMEKVNEIVTPGGDTQIITRSQRPHLYLNPSTCKGGCICAPFLWPYNYYDLINTEHPPPELGIMHIDSFAPLQQLNGGTDSVTVTVYARMINVKLTAPTTRLYAHSLLSNIDFDEFFINQAQADEYPDSGVVSGPASAVATYAGYLTTAPVIGPFALATQIGASAIGKIAKLFGYSKPIIVSDITPMRSYPTSSFALTEGGDTSQKLTLTAKQEISVDPGVCGMPSEDLLTLSSMAQRESYIESFLWETNKTATTVIYAFNVNPMWERRTALGNNRTIIPTSLSFATRPFTNWSGTLKYRFQFIASQYHRGRLAIIYDPKGPLDFEPLNTTFNMIVDLAEGRDFTFEVPWQQSKPYAKVDSHSELDFSSTVNPALLADNDKSNGSVYIMVINELVVPDTTTPVRVIVSISAGNDYEVVNPATWMDNFNYYAQSSNSSVDYAEFFTYQAQASAVEVVPVEENSPEATSNVSELIPKALSVVDQKPLIFYGEKFNSFRQLLKRFSFNMHLSYPSSTTHMATSQLQLRSIPCEPGPAPFGPHTTSAAGTYCYSGMTTFSYLKPCFAGWRGSIRWKIVPLSSHKVSQVLRKSGPDDNETAVSGTFFSYLNNPNTSTISSLAYEHWAFKRGTNSGTALTLNRTQDGFEFEVPMAVPFKFCSTRTYPWAATANSYRYFSPGGDTIRLIFTSATDEATIACDTYCAAGEDIQFLGWVGASVIYYKSTLPAPQ